MKRYIDYVNVFQGCGEIDLPKPEGIAAKWFFIKAGCGNTSPAACVPFGAMSAAPYSGGYPTGYGNHKPNSHSRPPKFDGGSELIGFAHLQQSGTGAIGYYYNYAVTVPKYENSPFRRAPENEHAQPGYYSCSLEDIKCELTSCERVSLHRYTFGKEGGVVTVNFDNNGLNIPDIERAQAEVLSISVNGSTVTATAVIEGVTLYFAVVSDCEATACENSAIFKVNGKTANLSIAISLKSEQHALSLAESRKDFDEVKAYAAKKWEAELSKIKIETADEEIKEIFYSNLYHSFIKPGDWSGDGFIYDGNYPLVADLNTLWDMYKTALPLILAVNRDIGEKTVETLMRLCETLKVMPNSFGISDEYKEPTAQARMLGTYVLLTAYRYGYDIDVKRMIKVIKTDLYAANKTDFTIDGKCGSHTWLLDMADACALTAQVAKENGDLETAAELAPFAALWRRAYSAETGLLGADSSYYEGTLYNYSFRQMVEMDERIKLAGGNENFVKLLDRFFGYGAEDTVQPTDPFNYDPVAEGIKLGRFEGFNNESDTESPFSYIYAGRHDRTCEIVRAGMKYMFTTGRGGIPGNNDSDALSSYYVFMALGLFPVAGQNLFLIGSPFVDSAEVSLFNGNTLNIKVNNNADENIYVKSVKFNGRELADYRITAKELLGGGTLEFVMG